MYFVLYLYVYDSVDSKIILVYMMCEWVCGFRVEKNYNKEQLGRMCLIDFSIAVGGVQILNISFMSYT